MRRFLFVLLAVAALAVPANAGAAACRTADSCKSLEHDSTTNAAKIVNVDATGAVLVGGRGSRVELLASGTDTTTATAATTITDITVPAWCDSLIFTARVGVTTGTNLSVSAVGYIDGTYAATSSDMTAPTIVTPTLSHFITIGMGSRFPFASTTTMSTNSHIRAYSVFLARYVRISRSYSVAPVGPSIQWVVYCYGG